MKRRRLRDHLWSTVDRWGPGAIAIVTLLASLWYNREVEGRTAGLQTQVISLQAQVGSLQAQLLDRSSVEVSLRSEIQVWQAYVVGLREGMIKAGIKAIPPSPQPAVQR